MLVKTHVIVTGLGDLGRQVAEVVGSHPERVLARFSFGQSSRRERIDGCPSIEVFNNGYWAGFREIAGQFLDDARKAGEPAVIVDCSKQLQSDVVLQYCDFGVPIILMGSEGRADPGNEELIRQTLHEKAPRVLAVRVPNGANHVAGALTAFRNLPKGYPQAFAGMEGMMVEGHQEKKGDSTPATATDLYESVTRSGAQMTEMVHIRDPKVAMAVLGVPEEYLDGHGVHIMRLATPDGLSGVEIKTWQYGRRKYAQDLADVIIPGIVEASHFDNGGAGGSVGLYDWPIFG